MKKKGVGLRWLVAWLVAWLVGCRCSYFCDDGDLQGTNEKKRCKGTERRQIKGRNNIQETIMGKHEVDVSE